MVEEWDRAIVDVARAASPDGATESRGLDVLQTADPVEPPD